MPRRLTAPVAAFAIVAALSALACSDDADGAAPATAPIATSTSTSTPTLAPAPPPAGVRRGQLVHHGLPRRYRIYIPPVVAAHPETPVPLLVALHAATGNAEGFARSTGFDVVARREGFVVVYPDGLLYPGRRGFQPTWNAGRCCGIAERLHVDDVGFVAALIAELQRELPLDPGRTYLAGHSNGAMLTFRLACERPELVTAAVAVSGGLEVDGCSGRGAVGLLAIHGDRDPVHPLDGGAGGVGEMRFRSMADSMRIVGRAQRCSPGTTGHVTGSLGVVEWRRCQRGVTVALVVIHGAGHGWPERPGSAIPSATEAAWRFFDSGDLPG